MNYREKMRKAIECPQFGNIDYGEWGSLRLDQRKDIKRLLDEMDRADEVVKHQYFEIERYKNIINELEKEIENQLLVCKEGQVLEAKARSPFDTYSGDIRAYTYLKYKLKELKEGNKE